MRAVVLGDSPVRLWGLAPAARIERQLRSEGIGLWPGPLEALPANETLLVLRGDCLYDSRVLRGLVKARDTLLEVDAGGRLLPVAAHVTAEQAPSIGALLRGLPSGTTVARVATVTLEQVAQGFEAGLLKLDRPYVLPVTAQNRGALGQLTFSGAYKGVTDLVHPPLWYLAWGIGLAPVAAVAGVPLPLLYVVIFAGYVGGRLCEGALQRWIASFSIFTWRPFDSWFRLIVARRNPNMLMLTASLAIGRPDLGLLAVAAWTALSTAILLLRVLVAAQARRVHGMPGSWLTEIGRTVDARSLTARVFTHAAPAAPKA